MPTRIFHITHVENLASIAEHGLLSDNAVMDAGLGHQSIAHMGIKQRRAETPVPCAPGGTLADYVPFYFAPRSPMLYTINQGNVGTVSDGQSGIVHLVLRAEDLMADQECVFTDGHAIMDFTNFFNDVTDLSQLDWECIETRQWGSYYDPTDETKRKKQSEFLALHSVPWERVRGIATPTTACSALVQKALEGVAHQPSVAVKRDWYY
ncbi:protein of unknown function [Blastococcus aggregatus]|uniref:DarT domain-containing protein n=1 Tax=Blastococcus aggregatus TaxID=38502 RepID=A0A285UXR8_9ACTN|nr:DUF4433 domain-containing protein [Blastococcus aggregatus]SOC46599.1 protein of unknown function [Blastococcus aggregatus]